MKDNPIVKVFKKYCALLVFGMATLMPVAALAHEESAVVDEQDEEFKHGEHDFITKEGFDITEFIFHHIGDSHEFTFWGGDTEGKTKWVGMHLPVILYANNGLSFFSSKEFELNNDASVIVEKNGEQFVRYHGKIYYASDSATDNNYVQLDDEGQVLNARPIDFSITKNVFSLLFAVALLLWLFLAVAKGYKKNAGKAPKGIQSFMEPIILFVRDEIARPNIPGDKYERYMPFLLTVFFFIWLNNMLGLIPFFPGSANVTGNIAVTAILALITLLITLFSGNKNYWGHILNPPVPWWMKPLMIPVEIIGIFTKPFALAIRLFANITAGHILVLSLLCLPFIFNSMPVAGGSVVFTIFIGLIEFLVAFIQAFIFTILSALYIGMAVEEPAEEH
ncbi:MAG TPA: F0F1 ATP synthase subunit A [Candidatus Sphingobacterium stercoripullorum]|nr:F0F1 ATP synthase subunit A [Candidatus Sphingobacterium stercoripullorum]